MSIKITYKSHANLEIPEEQGLIKLNFDTQISQKYCSEIQNTDLSLELAPNVQENIEGQLTAANDIATIEWLNNLLQKPLIISLIESVVTKDKKGKETEKQTLLGQCSFDLLNFLVCGSTEQDYTLELFTPNGGGQTANSTNSNNSNTNTPSGNENARSAAQDENALSTKPQITISIISTDILLSEKLLGQNWNVLDFRLLSTTLPDEGLVKDQDILVFIELADEKFTFVSSSATTGLINNNNYRLKWSTNVSEDTMAPGCIELENASECLITTASNQVIVDPKFGHLIGSNGAVQKAEIEDKMNKQNFVQHRRILLTHSQVTMLEDKLSLEDGVVKMYVGSRAGDDTIASGKGGAKKGAGATSEKPNKVKSLGSIDLNLKGLLYPGRNQIYGHFLLESNKKEAAESEEQTENFLLKEASEAVDKIFTHTTTEDPVHITSGFTTVDVQMLRPIVKARTLQGTVDKISEMIPERGQWPRIERGEKHAVLFLKTEIKRVVEFVLEKIRDSLGDVSKIPQAQREEARRKLFYDLTTSPDYQQYREQLKYSIIRIVREKYLYTTKFPDENSKQEFLSKLSIYLHEVLHETITEYFYVPTDTSGLANNNRNTATQKDTSSSNPNEQTGGITPSQILSFAKEAQMLGRTNVAERWYQELCARQPKNADNWFNYAIFCLSDGDIDKAQNCLCEAITLNPDHEDSLVCAPFVLCMTKHSFNEDPHNQKPTLSNNIHSFIEEGQLFLERAQHNAKKNDSDSQGLIWTLSALFHEYCMESNIYPKASIMMDQALMLSKEIECNQELDEFSIPNSLSLKAARFLIRCNLLSFAEKALAHELQHRGTAISMKTSLSVADISPQDRVFIAAHTASRRLGEYNCLLGQLHMMRGTKAKLALAENLFNQATQIYHRFTEAWAMLGHVQYMTGKVDQALQSYHRVLDDSNISSEISNIEKDYVHLVYLRLGRIHMDRNEYNLAKQVFIDSCNKELPTVNTWLGIGKACYYENKFEDAEDALAEANMLDQRHPDVWALLSMVCLQQSIAKPQVSRKDEAEQSFKYAVKMGCSDEVLLEELGNLQVRAGMGDPRF